MLSKLLNCVFHDQLMPVRSGHIPLRQTLATLSRSLQQCRGLFMTDSVRLFDWLADLRIWPSQTNVGLHQEYSTRVLQVLRSVEQSFHHFFERRLPDTDTFDSLGLAHLGPRGNADGRLRHSSRVYSFLCIFQGCFCKTAHTRRTIMVHRVAN